MPEKVEFEIEKGLLGWYPFRRGGSALYVGEETEAVYELLLDRGFSLLCRSTGEELLSRGGLPEWQGAFDYIVGTELLEKTEKPERLLSVLSGLLSPGGRLLLGCQNRLGIRYFCGDRDPYTERSFDGIENYRRALASPSDTFPGRCYDKAELCELLSGQGFSAERRRIYSVLSGLRHPVLLLAEGYTPNEELSSRLKPSYHFPDTVFLEEEYLYGTLFRNQLFHTLANAYLVECSMDGELSDALQVTCSVERGREDAFYSVLRERPGEGRLAEKRAAYPEGQARFFALLRNAEDLCAHGVRVVEAELRGDVYTMPYIYAESALVHLRRLLRTDREGLISAMDLFRDTLLRSAEIEEGEEDGKSRRCLRRGYFDLVPLNAFYSEGEYLFFDQEFCIERLPLEVLLTRLVDIVYEGAAGERPVLPAEFFLKRYGLEEELPYWREQSREFLMRLRRERELHLFEEKHCRNLQLVHQNRQRLNYTEKEYQKRFVRILDGLDEKELYLFGSGNFTKHFLMQFGEYFRIAGILDNNAGKWGQSLQGIEILSPGLLREKDPGEYRVILCLKSYPSALRQLQALGAEDYAVYDVSVLYPEEYTKKPAQKTRKGRSPAHEAGEEKGLTEQGPIPVERPQKKYRRGYIAGVFDLFHVGHLNLLRRAKEQCEYLIVGVVSDEGVRRFKHVEPFVPFEERREIVAACKYVDEAVEIPLEFAGTRDAYRLHRFDVQFSGSDYAEDPLWLSEREFLKKQGAELVFFPYTETTNSTQLKSLIRKRLGGIGGCDIPMR